MSIADAPRAVRVHLVDDHPVIREGLREILVSRFPIEVVGESGNVEDARLHLGRTQPDVVVLDHHLPGLTGIEACPQLMGAHPGVRVVMFTRATEWTAVRQALAHGAGGFVVKSTDLDVLWRAIREVHAGRRFVDPAIVRRRPLSAQELAALGLAADGRATPEIARSLCLAPSTVDTYINRAARKLGARNRKEAIAIAARAGLV